MGNGLPVDKGAPEKSQSTGSRSYEEPGSQMNTQRHMEQESSGKEEHRQFIGTDASKTHADVSTSVAIGALKLAVSENVADLNLETVGTNSGRFLEKSFPTEREEIQVESSNTASGKSPLQSEELNNGPSTSASSQQGTQSPSVAISPEDMHNSVFAVVEEEMGGDPAYLVAIIVEFLRRYAAVSCFYSVNNSIFLHVNR